MGIKKNRQVGNEKIDSTEFACLTINADLEKDNEILLQALRLACKTLYAVCVTQNYMLGLGLKEQYFIKKAKETLKND